MRFWACFCKKKGFEEQIVEGRKEFNTIPRKSTAGQANTRVPTAQCRLKSAKGSTREEKGIVDF
jgi:hypothetical protein